MANSHTTETMTTNTKHTGGRAELIAELLEDYCHCLDAYKHRGMTDPQCESCNTKDLRNRAAALLSDDKAVGDRFFLDHGMWHDRETGQHLFTQDEYDEGCRATVSEYKRRQDEDAHIQHPRNTPLHTRPQPQADDKKDAALKACVEAMQQAHIIGGQAAIDAAITQAQEALK